jgi:hypothetical protein
VGATFAENTEELGDAVNKLVAVANGKRVAT